MHRTFDFATIGFRPFPETQEFVTIGALALDTAARHFDFVLQDARKTGRVAAMFPKAGKALFREDHATLKKELESIRAAVNGAAEGKDVPVFPAFRGNENGLFAAITSPREGVFCYPVRGRRMAADMDDVLGILKTRFIDQDGLTVQQVGEQQMAKAIKNALRAAKLLHHPGPSSVGSSQGESSRLVAAWGHSPPVQRCTPTRKKRREAAGSAGNK